MSHKKRKRECSETVNDIHLKQKKVQTLTPKHVPSSAYEHFQFQPEPEGPTLATINMAPETRKLEWQKFRAENLDLDYVKLFSKKEANDIFQQLEKTVVYNTGQLAKVRMFGKWVDIPRKQTAYGEAGLTYTFSGNTVPARPWIPALTRIRDLLTMLTSVHFNFVLVNRYKDGNDYMGEHKDDEKDLKPDQPIASLSLGQPRDFFFRHQDSRGRSKARAIDKVSLVLEHGSLLLMNAPTNQYWYHALPKRKAAKDVRLNLTFRSMNQAMCKPAKCLLDPHPDPVPT